MLLAGMNRTDSYLQFITVLILFVIVLGITYLTTRWIAGYQKGKAAGSNLEILEAMRIANNKYLQIIRVGNKYFVIAVGKDEIHMIAEVPEEELIFHTGGKMQEMDFKGILEKFKRQNAKEDD